MQVRPRLQPTGHLASDTPQIMRRPEGDMRRTCSAVDGEAMEIIAEWGEIHCPGCGEGFLTPEQCIRFRQL